MEDTSFETGTTATIATVSSDEDDASACIYNEQDNQQIIGNFVVIICNSRVDTVTMADQNLNDGLQTGSVNDEIETSLPQKNDQTLVKCNNETLPIAMVAIVPDRASSSSLDVEEQEDPNKSLSHRGLEQTVEELKKELAELRKEFELKLEKLAKENAELKTEIAALKRENSELKRENSELKREVAVHKREVAELIKSMEKAAHYWNEDDTNNDFVDADSTTHHGRTESPPTLVGRTTTTLDACEEESEKKGHKVLATVASEIKVDADSTTHDGRTESPPTFLGGATSILHAFEEESEKKGHKVLAVAASQVHKAVRYHFGKSKKKN
ncbi:hypothetical protein ACA910_009308 [Epithemia clementina (nom. ined.)]